MKKSLMFMTGIAGLFLLFLGACSQPVSLSNEGLAAAVVEAEAEAYTGKDYYTPDPDEHFFFLPPLAPVPEYSGTFAAGLEVLVRVGIMDEGSLLPLAEFTVGGKGSERVRQSSSDGLGDFYIVNMNLKKYDVSAGMQLLIEVFSEERKLGELPVVLIKNGSEKKNNEGPLPLVINRTVPIKFRIEEEYFNAPVPGSIVVWGSPNMPQELLVVPEQDDFIALALGTNHGIGLREDGSLVSWGSDNYGQISGTPAGTGFISVDAGLLYSLVLHEDGTVYSWGGGLCANQENAPSGTGFTDIAAGYGFALALNAAGEFSSWSLSDPMTATIPTGSGYMNIRAGEYLALAFDSAGQLELFGSSSTGVLEAEIPAGSFLYADAGEYHAAGILSDGRLVSWGGSTAAANDLIQGFDDGPYCSVALGKFLGVGLRTNGTLRTFGSSALDVGLPENSDGFVAIAANRDSAAAAIRRAE